MNQFQNLFDAQKATSRAMSRVPTLGGSSSLTAWGA